MTPAGDDSHGRTSLGDILTHFRNNIDNNLQIFRLGCVAVLIGSVGLLAHSTGKVIIVVYYL